MKRMKEVKNYNKIVLFAICLLFTSNIYSQQQSTTISHKPKDTGYEFSVDVVWNIIPCYGKIKVNIAVDLDNIDIKAYHYKGKSYTPSDIGMSNFKSNIRIVDLSAYVIYDQMNYGELLMKNVNNYTNAGCYGQTFGISEMLTLSSVQDYIDNIGQFRLQDIHITNDAFIDHILNTKIKELEKEEKEEQEEKEENIQGDNNTVDNEEDFWSIDETDKNNNEPIVENQKDEGYWDLDTEAKTQKQNNNSGSNASTSTSGHSSNGVQNGKLVDADGNTYQTVVIGSQIWMAENLKTTKYNDGTAIPNVEVDRTWVNLTTGAYCWFENDASLFKNTYGALYNWYTVETNKLCPTNWHVPSDDEWKQLEMALGMSQVEVDGIEYRGTNEGSKLAGNATLWFNRALVNNAEFGTSGFNGVGSSGRISTNYSEFGYLTTVGVWWSVTEYNSSNAWVRQISFDHTTSYRGEGIKKRGYSIRCIKDK